jgi:hypothetical protein
MRESVEREIERVSTYPVESIKSLQKIPIHDLWHLFKKHSSSDSLDTSSKNNKICVIIVNDSCKQNDVLFFCFCY